MSAPLKNWSRAGARSFPGNRWFARTLLGVALLAGPVFAEGDVGIDDDNPRAALPTPEQRAQNPVAYGAVLIELIERADGAFRAGEFERAARYYEAIVTAVPEQALGFRKLCEARSRALDLAGAIPACREALTRDGVTTADHVRYLATMLARPDSPSAEEIQEVDRSLAHLREQKAVEPDLELLNCELALRIDDLARLQTCTEALEQSSPRDARTAAYSWALAMAQGDRAAAEGAFERARTLGHDSVKLQQMKQAMAPKFPRRWALAGGAAVLLLVGLGTLLFARLRKLRGGTTQATLATS